MVEANQSDKRPPDVLRIQIQQLFTPAAPISRKDLFAGRTTQLRRLVDAVTEAGRHAVLYGERGVGKTSIANIFEEVLSAAYDNGGPGLRVIRKQASPQDTYSDLWRKVFREMRVELRRAQLIGFGREGASVESGSTSDFYPDTITPDDVVSELRTVDDTLIVIFDEFDKLLNYDAKRLMSHTIKAISDTGARATIVLVGVADDINTLVDEHQSITRNIAEIKMPRMSRGELNEILDGRYAKVKMTINTEARRKIVSLARGLPEYVHTLGRAAAIIAVNDGRRAITEVDVDAAIRDTLQYSEQSTNSAYKRAIDSNKQNALYSQVLVACALAKADDEGKFAAKDVVEPLHGILGLRRKVEIATFQSHLAAFCGTERGAILERHGRERAFKYRFREPKMQPFVIMQGIAVGWVGPTALTGLTSSDAPSFDF